MKTSYYRKSTLLLYILIFFTAGTAFGQMKPQLVNANKPESAIFKAPEVIIMPSVKNLYSQTLNMSIYHTFGLVKSGINQFYGLDGGANIRLGLDYGITDNLSVGLGRTSINKIVDGRFKYTILHQMTSGNPPLELAMSGDVGITTIQHPFSTPYTVGDRLGYSYMIMAARKFNDRLTLQVAPVIAHFNRVYPGEKNTYYGMGLSGRYKLTDHTSLALEYVPVFNKTSGMTNAFSVAFNIETGGHVFQLFFSNAQSFNPQDIMRHTNDKFFNGYFRFGFNINRIFWFKDKNKQQ